MVGISSQRNASLVFDLKKEKRFSEYDVTLHKEDPYMQAAVLLHTDLAIGDGRHPVGDFGEFHLGVAERLMDLIEDPSRRRSFQRDWQLAVGYYFQSMLLSERALEHFDEDDLTAGWHTLDVRLKHIKADVRARRGYYYQPDNK